MSICVKAHDVELLPPLCSTDRGNNVLPAIAQSSVEPIPQQIKHEFLRAAGTFVERHTKPDVGADVLSRIQRDLRLGNDVPMNDRSGHEIPVRQQFGHGGPGPPETLALSEGLAYGFDIKTERRRSRERRRKDKKDKKDDDKLNATLVGLGATAAAITAAATPYTFQPSRKFG